MTLQNFNVFGTIFVTKSKTKISATAFSSKRPKSISNTYKDTNEKLAGLVIPFAAHVGKGDTLVLFGERSIKVETEQVANSALYLNELKSLEDKLVKFLAFFN